MASTRQKAKVDLTPQQEAARAIELVPGKWYIGAADTSPIPVGFALDTIEERLVEAKFGSVRFYREKSELPPETPPEVRDALDANVWASAQFLPPGGGTAPVTIVAPPGLLALGELSTAPPKPGPLERSTKVDDEIPTRVIVAATAGVLLLGGGAIWLAWYLKRKRKKKNGKKRK